MAEFIQALDPVKLVLGGTVLSFLISPFTVPYYNLPIFLFGIYAQERSDSEQSLQTFTGLLGFSAFYDLLWIFQHEQGAIVKLLSFVLLILKVPTFLAFGIALRQRGAQFGNIGIRGGDATGQTVWSMPGGFTSNGRDGYQAVEEETVTAAARKPTAPPASNNQPVGGGYQSV